MTIDSSVMLKRLTTAFIAMCLILPTTPAFAYSILWVSTSDHTDLVKDEEYEAAPLLMLAVPGVEVASESVECEEGGLEILYEEAGPEELADVEDIPVPPEPISVEEEVSPELISVEDEPVEPEEIELEEPLYDQIQEP